jgi:hypothetical protein
MRLETHLNDEWGRWHFWRLIGWIIPRCLGKLIQKVAAQRPPACRHTRREKDSSTRSEVAWVVHLTDGVMLDSVLGSRAAMAFLDVRGSLTKFIDEVYRHPS